MTGRQDERAPGPVLADEHGEHGAREQDPHVTEVLPYAEAASEQNIIRVRHAAIMPA